MPSRSAQRSFHYDLVRGRLSRQQFNDLVQVCLEGQGCRINLFLSRGRHRGRHEFDHLDARTGKLRPKRFRVGVHAGLRSAVGGHQQVQLLQPLLTVTESVVLFGQHLDPAVLITAVVVLGCVGAAQRTRVTARPQAKPDVIN